MGAGGCHQWPLSRVEQSHKLRWQELLIQQVLIWILGLMGETLAISLSMNDFYGEKQRVMENATKERICPSYGSVSMLPCVFQLLCWGPWWQMMVVWQLKFLLDGAVRGSRGPRLLTWWHLWQCGPVHVFSVSWYLAVPDQIWLRELNLILIFILGCISRVMQSRQTLHSP